MSDPVPVPARRDSPQRSFVTPPPAHLGCELRQLVSDHYGPVSAWETLGGEDDLNVRVELPGGSAFLKVSWVDGSGFADFQTRLIGYLSTRTAALPVAAIIPTLEGAWSLISNEITERPLHLRMTTFLSGASARGLSLNTEMVYAVGLTLARLDQALAEVDMEVPDRPTNWNIMDAGDVLADLIPARLTDGNDEHRVWRTVIESFVDAGLPLVATWPRQLIHNDLNGSNLLLDRETGEVTGLLDFGDVASAPRVVDVAVAAAYLIDGSSVDAYIDSLAAILAGYHSHWALSYEEVRVVPEIMKARYALALLLNYARADASTDAGYIRYVHRNTATSRAKLALLTDPTTADRTRRLVEEVGRGE
jgi:hydroxylysine kinase